MRYHTAVMPYLGWIGVVFGLLIFVSSAEAQLEFSESDFHSGSFTVQLVQGGSGSNSIVSQIFGEGNPVPSLSVRHELVAGEPAGGFCASWIWTFFSMSGAIIDPATMGAIESIDFSLDSSPIASTFPGNEVQSQSAVVFQDGRIFIGGSTVTPNTSGWSTHISTALVESDFTEVINQPPCEFTDPSSHPDFSQQGSTIHLGFARGSSTGLGGGGQALFREVGADNWSMTVHVSTVSAVYPILLDTKPNLTIKPNPSQGMVTLMLKTPRAQAVDFKLYDVTGRLVRNIGTVYCAAGLQNHSSNLNSGSSRPLPTGVYFMRATGSDFSVSKRVVLVR